ncbi:MAG: class I SAM-dependent methyltransferase [Oscillospiraceae bacterium]|nr:class I SAM-dependent methyltransferase [Oscillospiraceae bacterium]
MNETTFWNDSWSRIGSERIKEDSARHDMSEDAVIRYLKDRGAAEVCDAGCGCGFYSLKLASHGFNVSGFDISPKAVELARLTLSESDFPTQSFRAADIAETGFADGRFDAVVARDVLDHMPIKAAVSAVKELLRITRPGGCVLITLDKTDDEYESEPHTVTPDGDYIFAASKWKGMTFHPYSPCEIDTLTAGLTAMIMEESETGYTAVIEK